MTNEPPILEIVNTIFQDSLNEEDKKTKYKSVYPLFIESHPTLFEMACKSDFDFNQFERMIKLKRSIDDGKISHHDASVKIGTELFNTYVKDKVQK
jgi:hypothetical protein